MAQTVSELVARISGDVSDLQSKLNEADGKVSGFASGIASKATKIAADVGKIAGAAALAIGGASLKAAIDFESQFANVRKTVDATDTELQELRDTIRDMATSSENPLSALENTHETLTNIMALGGQLGIETQDLGEFTQTVGAMTVATNLGAEEAATFFARFANVTGLPTEDFRNMGDVIVTLGNNMATTEDQIAKVGMRLAPLATFGWEPQKIIAYGAAMSSLGMSAELGSTNLLKTVGQMTTAVATGGPELQRFAKIAGMTADEFSRLNEEDPAAAFDAFVAGLGKLDADEQIIQLQKLGITSIEQVSSLQRLAAGFDTVEQSIGLADEAFKGNGALMTEAAAKADTTAGSINTMKNNITDQAITLGDKLLPGVNKAVGGLTQLMQGDTLSGLDTVFSGVTTAVSDFFGAGWNIPEDPITVWVNNLKMAGDVLTIVFDDIKRRIEIAFLDIRLAIVSSLADLAESDALKGLQDIYRSLGVKEEYFVEDPAIAERNRLQAERNAYEYADRYSEVLREQMGKGDINLDQGVEMDGLMFRLGSVMLDIDPNAFSELDKTAIQDALNLALSSGDWAAAKELIPIADLIEIDTTGMNEVIQQGLLDSAIAGGDMAGALDVIEMNPDLALNTEGMDIEAARLQVTEWINMALSAEDYGAVSALADLALELGIDPTTLQGQADTAIQNAIASRNFDAVANINLSINVASINTSGVAAAVAGAAAGAAPTSGTTGPGESGIPVFHGGGKYENPSGQGLAWLQDNEVVLTENQQATVAAFAGSGGRGGGGDTFVVNSYGTNPYELVDNIDRTKRGRGRK